MPIEFRVISIGTLSRHPLWDETLGARTAHATTTLIRSGERTILVDPGLPAQVQAAKLAERCGIGPDAITDVFLTNFRPAHRAGLAAFENARWWLHEPERELIGVELVSQFERASDEDVREVIRQEIAILKRCEPAPDELAEGVDLFPLPGYTPGTCGLLLPLPHETVLIASDAIATSEHLERGQILARAYDLQAAAESLKEAVGIADWIIPGHDNLVHNLAKGAF